VKDNVDPVQVEKKKKTFYWKKRGIKFATERILRRKSYSFSEKREKNIPWRIGTSYSEERKRTESEKHGRKLGPIKKLHGLFEGKRTTIEPLEQLQSYDTH